MKFQVSLIQSSAYHPDVEKAPPLGLAYLAAALRREAIECRLIDMKAHDMSVRQVVEEYKESMSPYVGIGSITLDSASMHKVAAGIKDANPEVFIVAGGPHATAYHEELLRDGNIDAAVLYDGEDSFVELIRAREDGRDPERVPGLAFRRNGGVVRTEPRSLPKDLDRLAMPAWDMVSLEKYWDAPRIAWVYKHREYATITTTRGCPFSCAYCHRTLGKTWRKHGIDRIIEELWRLKKDHGVREIVPVDDMFNLSDERTQTFARRVIEENLNLAFHFPVGFRCELLSDETILLLKKAGMYRCMVAIETASPRLQKTVKRNMDIPKTKEVIEKIARAGVLVHGVFILGLPTETREEMRRTERFALDSKLHSLAISIAIPFKNSGLIELAREGGITFEDDFDNYSFTNSQINLTQVPMKWILGLRRSIYRRFFTPMRLLRFFRLLPNPHRHLFRLGTVFVRKAFFW